MKRLEKIAQVTERRGPHAFGIAWIDSKGRLKMFKQAGRISDYLGILSMAADARLLIGHCRYATHGTPGNNLNNHPHSADGGWIVHNGVIGEYEALLERHDLQPVTECDSEVLGMLIERGEGTVRERAVAAISAATSNPLTMLGLWSRPGKLIALRAGNPLSIGLCGGRVYLASLQEGLPGKVAQIYNGCGLEIGSTMREFRFAKNVTKTTGETLY